MPSFRANYQKEVELLMCLHIHQYCDMKRAYVTTSTEWKNVFQEMIKNTSSIVRYLIPSNTLSQLKVCATKKKTSNNLDTPYFTVETCFKNCVQKFVKLLATNKWSVFEEEINCEIETLCDSLCNTEHKFVLDYHRYPLMCEQPQSYEDDSTENDTSEESDEEDDILTDKPRSLEELVILVMNDLPKSGGTRSRNSTELTNESKEFMSLLQDRKKNSSKSVDLQQFDKMSRSEKIGLIESLKKVNAEKSRLPLLFRLLTSRLPTSVINEAMQRFESSRSESEGTKYTTWVNGLLKLPFQKYVEPEFIQMCKLNDVKKSATFFQNTRKQLDSVVYGHKEAKDHLIKYIAQMTRHAMTNNSKSKGLVLGIQGPCGNGKTTLIEKGISKVLNLPFAAIPLGGATDSAFLNGHSYTYEGSVWGQIADVLMKTKCSNPIIYMDELDKVSNTYKGQEIINELIHLTDPSQNSHFQDRYFGNIDIDLSHVTWVFSYNDASQINYVLRDRITEIQTSGFTLPEKLKIVEKFLIPSVCTEIGMPHVSISNDIIKYMINGFTYEGGVRKIKELLFEVCRSLNMDDLCGTVSISKRRKSTIKGSYSRYNMTMEEVIKYLNHKRHIQKETIHNKPMIGRINGLYASSMIDMGGVIAIETQFVPSDNVYGLSLTGNLGKVMKESGTVAKTLAWDCLHDTTRSSWETRWKTVKESIHIHCPEGAVNKDGPSAGTALTVAIISLLSNNKIKNNIAITGEINLSGDVLAIGGLRSKLYGAKSAGCSLALFPKDNQEDYEKIRKECTDLFDDTFNAVSVATLNDVIPYVFENTNGLSSSLTKQKSCASSVKESGKLKHPHQQMRTNKRKYHTRSQA